MINVAEEAARAIERARARGTLPVIGIASLDALVSAYGVTAIEPAFPHAPDLDAVKARLPERAQRAPPDANSSGLSRFYTLHFDPAINVQQAVAAFSANPYIESAQPDYLATTYSHQEGSP